MYCYGAWIWGGVVLGGNLYATAGIIRQNSSERLDQHNMIPMMCVVSALKALGYGISWPVTFPYLAWSAYQKRFRPVLNAFVPFGSTANYNYETILIPRRVYLALRCAALIPA